MQKNYILVNNYLQKPLSALSTIIRLFIPDSTIKRGVLRLKAAAFFLNTPMNGIAGI
jgi:hypothetical protein